MGCTQSHAAVVVATNDAASHHCSITKSTTNNNTEMSFPKKSICSRSTSSGSSRNGRCITTKYDTCFVSDHPMITNAPDSTKSMNTASTTMTTNTGGSSGSSRSSSGVHSNSSTTTSVAPRIAPVWSYEMDDDDEEEEVTTEYDEESVQSMRMNSISARSQVESSYFFTDNDTNQRHQNTYMMIDEMSTDEYCHHTSTGITSNNHPIPYNDSNCTRRDGELNVDGSTTATTKFSSYHHDVENDPPIPCTILTIRKADIITKSTITADSQNTSGTTSTATESSSSCQYDSHRALSIHQEQQRRLLSLMTTVLPWTHAIVLRKQRQVQVRQKMMTSLLWFRYWLFLWPSGSSRLWRARGTTTSSSSTTTTTRIRNPTTLFRR